MKPVRFIDKTITVLLVVFVAAQAVGQSQVRASFLDQPAEVRLPSDYDSALSYPVYVFLPYTGGRASDLYERMLDIVEYDNAIVVLPSGRPRSEHYLPDFMSFVRWYEERLLKDLDRIEREYSVDTDGIVLAGFSLGGDLAWALSLRNPDRFAGAVMGGTRASYPAPTGALDTLARRGFRAAFIIGSSELAARSRGIARAEALLRGGGVETRYRTVDGGHTYGSETGFVEDLHWALDANGLEMRGGPAGTVTFPNSSFHVVLDLEGTWSTVEESRVDGYDVAFTSERGPMRVRMFASFGDPIPPQEHLREFVDGLPFTRDIEYYTIRKWDGYLGDYVDQPLVTGISESRRFIASAWWPDYYPVLAVASVPDRLGEEYMDEMRRILE